MSSPTLFVFTAKETTSVAINGSAGITDQIDVDSFGSPTIPCFTSGRGQQFGLGLSRGVGEYIGRLSSQHDVFGVFHHPPSDAGRMQMSTQAADAAAGCRRLHHTGIERDLSVPVGQTTESNRVDFGIGLDSGRGGDDRIQRPATGLKIRPSGLMASEPE